MIALEHISPSLDGSLKQKVIEVLRRFPKGDPEDKQKSSTVLPEGTQEILPFPDETSFFVNRGRAIMRKLIE